MNKRSRIFFAGIAMLLLILDTKTSIAGATEGLDLCLKVIIPSLFPFFVLSNILNSALIGSHIPGLGWLCRKLQIPRGGESLLLLGLLGGYPVGAKIIADTYRQGKLQKETAHCMLRYCSNAGPAFIFGVAGTLFSSSVHVWLLWGIHILSALATALFFPKSLQEQIDPMVEKPTTLPQALQDSLKVCASVCGWIIIFKVILVFLAKVTGLLHTGWLDTILGGILEISNGCTQLTNVTSASKRFILCSGFLAFGGLCVLLQTATVAGKLGIRSYIEGKLFQLSVSLILATVTSYVIFPECEISLEIAAFTVILTVISIIVRNRAIKRCGNFAENTV